MTYQKRWGKRWHAAAGVALLATLSTVAGSLTSTASSAFASTTTTTAAATDSLPNWGKTLAEVQAQAAAAISIRLSALQAAIKTVQSDTFLGSDATTLVNDMQSDITGLGALGTKIAADTTVAQAIADADMIFTEFRVYYVMLPVVRDVTKIDSHRQCGRPRPEQGRHHAPGRRELFQPTVHRPAHLRHAVRDPGRHGCDNRPRG